MASVLQVNGKWRAQIRMKGFQPRCATFLSESEAREWAATQEKQLRAIQRNAALDPETRPLRYQQAGVYALFKGLELRYIGRSVHVYRRLNDHARKAMDWDGYRLWPCRDSIEAADLERKLIRKHKPPLNTQMLPDDDAQGKHG